MPVRWTAETDQHLLIKILEASQQTIDYAKVASLWSLDGSRPTSKAISERIAKIKKLNNISSTPGTPSKPKSRTAVQKTPKKTPTKSSTASPSKRKRGGPMAGYGSDDNSDDDESGTASDEIIGVPVKEEAGEEDDDCDDGVEESPSKRVKGMNGFVVPVKQNGSPSPVKHDDEEEDIKTFSAFDDPSVSEVPAEMW